MTNLHRKNILQLHFLIKVIHVLYHYSHQPVLYYLLFTSATPAWPMIRYDKGGGRAILITTIAFKIRRNFSTKTKPDSLYLTSQFNTHGWLWIGRWEGRSRKKSNELELCYVDFSSLSLAD